MFICLVYMPFTKESSAHCRLMGSFCFIRDYLSKTASDIKIIPDFFRELFVVNCWSSSPRLEAYKVVNNQVPRPAS
jgi:hypothetical protein